VNLDVKYLVEKDASTYINFIRNFNSFKHGRDGIQNNLLAKLAPPLQEIIKNAETDEGAFEELTAHLEQVYKDNPEPIENGISKLKSSWDTVGGNIIHVLEFLYQKPFPFESVTVLLTTNNIFPHNYEKRYFYTTYKGLSVQLNTIKHELNHFMFYYYYESLKDKLDDEKYELLKEALTFFSNPEKEGKPNERSLRELFKSKLWKNLDEAIGAGTQYLLEN
jgi:hypothetical protein